MQPPRRALPGMAAVALTTLMGVHALRGFLAMIVWSIGVERPAGVARPALLLGGIALGLYAAGLGGWLAASRLEGGRAGTRRAVLFSGLYAISQYVSHPLLTPILAFAVAIAWLWFLPAMIGRLIRRSVIDVLAPGLLVGFAAEVALQTALHGLDLAMLRGILPGFGATALAAALVISWRWLGMNQWEEGEPRYAPGWGMLAFGPCLVLQLVLLANVGRAEMATGAVLPIAVLPVLVGLALGAVAIAVPAYLPLRIAAAVVAVVALLQPAWLERQGAVLFIIAQVALSVALAAALQPVAVRGRSTTYAAGAAGLLLAFVGIFLYHSRYEWPPLWPVLAALVALPAVVRRAAIRPVRSKASVLVVIVAGLLGVAAGSIPARSAAPGASGITTLRVTTYNIHMGFDALGVPDPPAVARVIETLDPDIIALQEVGRGWNVNGGAELFAWLRWRFPQYQAVYGPINGDLWGNAILSRVPISDQGSLRFSIRESKFQRGLTWVTLQTPRGEILVIATHFANEEEAEVDRLGQAEDLLAFWHGRPRTIVMGDFNTGPDSAPVAKLRAAGLRDALAPLGLGTVPTFPSLPEPTERIDYVSVTADIEPVAAAIPRTTASDHLPVVVQLRVR